MRRNYSMEYRETSLAPKYTSLTHFLAAGARHATFFADKTPTAFSFTIPDKDKADSTFVYKEFSSSNV